MVQSKILKKIPSVEHYFLNRRDYSARRYNGLIKKSVSPEQVHSNKVVRMEKNFRNKIYICKKEANETKYWIKILARHHQELKEKIRTFWREAHECHLIFQKITKTLDGRV